MPTWTDVHNHLHDPRFGDPAPLIAAMQEVGVTCCVVNATREDDWHAVADLAARFSEFVRPAFGIHPWHADTATDGWRERLADLLTDHPHASLGECGLDGWVNSPPLDVQLPVFQAQLDLAREMDRPITIHCLKAWNPLFDVFAASPPPRFLMHSFGGSLELANRLIPLGAWFSFSGYFLQPRKSKILEVIRNLPHERILVETDAPDMLPISSAITHPLPAGLNHPANLPAIANSLAAALSITPDELAAITRDNTQRWLEG